MSPPQSISSPDNAPSSESESSSPIKKLSQIESTKENEPQKEIEEKSSEYTSVSSSSSSSKSSGRHRHRHKHKHAHKHKYDHDRKHKHKHRHHHHHHHKSRRPRSYSSSSSSNSRSPSPTIKTRNLFIGNVPFYLTEKDLIKTFSCCGPVYKVHVGYDSKTGRGKGYAFVSYYNISDAKRAYRHFKGLPLDGRELRVDWDMGIYKKRAIGMGTKESAEAISTTGRQATKVHQEKRMSSSFSSSSGSSSDSQSSR